jgi:2-methylisocitrate lyase-like PEP mutase family enzyme
MTNDRTTRRRFMTCAGAAAGGVLGSTMLPAPVAAQGARPAQAPGGTSAAGTSAAATSRAARFRAAIANPQGFVMPVVNSVLMARLCEMEGFSGGFIGGSGFAAQFGLPNYSLGTLSEVMDYASQIMEGTDLPILADAEDGGGSPMLVYRVVQALERAGAACIMIEDAVDPRTHFNGKGAPVASAELMTNRVKAAVDARRDSQTMILVRSDAPDKGYPEQHTLDVASTCAAAGADAFFFSGFTLDQQQKAKNVLKKPLMIGSSGPAADWKSKGVDMAFYHVENVGLGAIHMALKELKATGQFAETGKMRLSADLNARLVDQAGWQGRAKKYGVMI